VVEEECSFDAMTNQNSKFDKSIHSECPRLHRLHFLPFTGTWEPLLVFEFLPFLSESIWRWVPPDLPGGRLQVNQPRVLTTSQVWPCTVETSQAASTQLFHSSVLASRGSAVVRHPPPLWSCQNSHRSNLLRAPVFISLSGGGDSMLESSETVTEEGMLFPPQTLKNS